MVNIYGHKWVKRNLRCMVFFQDFFWSICHGMSQLHEDDLTWFSVLLFTPHEEHISYLPGRQICQLSLLEVGMCQMCVTGLLCCVSHWTSLTRCDVVHGRRDDHLLSGVDSAVIEAESSASGVLVVSDTPHARHLCHRAVRLQVAQVRGQTSWRVSRSVRGDVTRARYRPGDHYWVLGFVVNSGICAYIALLVSLFAAQCNFVLC